MTVDDSNSSNFLRVLLLLFPKSLQKCGKLLPSAEEDAIDALVFSHQGKVVDIELFA